MFAKNIPVTHWRRYADIKGGISQNLKKSPGGKFEESNPKILIKIF